MFKQKRTKDSKLILIGANLIPLFGVLFGDWNFFSVILIFWAENAVLGFFNIFRILKAEKGEKFSGAGKIGLAIFFLIHFGFFTLVHGVFVFAFFGQNQALNPLALAIGFSGLFLSHGYSFFKNYLGREEYKNITTKVAMFLPYKRIVILHLTIILGGFLAMMFRAGFLAVVFLIILKIMIDLGIHTWEHERYLEKRKEI